MSDRHAFCRALEAYLCQKNDGHLIRIVGPAFDAVLSWADQGIPLKVAQAGIDRYFERYYRKGPRRRPVRVEFCEADVLDAFDEWRRAVGVSLVAGDAEGGPLVEEPVPGPSRARRSLKAHLEALMARLTVLRGSDRLGGTADAALLQAVGAVEALAPRAAHARGDERSAIIDQLRAIDRTLVETLAAILEPVDRTSYETEARAALEPFRARMTDEAYAQALDAATARQVRQHFGLPDFTI